MQRHLFQVGKDLAPLFPRCQVTAVAADEFLEDAAFKFMPGRAVASIDITSIGNIVLVIGIVIYAHVEGIEVVAYHFFHVCRVERTCVKGECANQAYLHQWAQISLGMFGPVAKTILFEPRIDTIWLIQAIDKDVATRLATSAEDMAAKLGELKTPMKMASK